MYEATGRLTACCTTKGTLRIPRLCRYEKYLEMQVPRDVVEEKPVRLMGVRKDREREHGGVSGVAGGTRCGNRGDWFGKAGVEARLGVGSRIGRRS